MTLPGLRGKLSGNLSRILVVVLKPFGSVAQEVTLTGVGIDEHMALCTAVVPMSSSAALNLTLVLGVMTHSLSSLVSWLSGPSSMGKVLPRGCEHTDKILASEVPQGLHSDVRMGNFAEPLALPDVHGHHRRVVVLHPLNVSRVAVHGHHQAVAVGHKVSHLCGEPKSGHAISPVRQKVTLKEPKAPGSLTVFGVVVRQDREEMKRDTASQQRRKSASAASHQSAGPPHTTSPASYLDTSTHRHNEYRLPSLGSGRKAGLEGRGKKMHHVSRATGAVHRLNGYVLCHMCGDLKNWIWEEREGDETQVRTDRNIKPQRRPRRGAVERESDGDKQPYGTK
ncbi:hypothetical protein EYF80_023649 [Liparis tanakae]|uniref:Uncharacterized protein n=1 Tax=Liparis tanakae TaxID=230148 RepID=A0A4Z2HKP5_9TELE|nr:hypothetical protein EYF80_023649 [Liparis tanakae]